MQGARSSRLGLFIFLMGAALLGVLFGTLIYCYVSDEWLSLLVSLREDFLQNRLANDFGGELFKSFGTSFIFLLTIYLLGLCAAGQPFVVMVIIYRAIGIGAAAASVFSAYGKSGITIFAFLLLPEGAAGLLILILAARESICMSGVLFKNILSENGERGMIEITKLYSVKLLVLLAAAGAAALIQSISSIAYIKLFSA